ncbi:lactoylglutathione lyase [Deinococcus piscis]|uniref:Lactoylglutathione lyase n=1 Tax=Deinococcus piscis TaxID=394230 RepID=A0ABQ3K693_9DEIO|nr:VOC family protein [Deinococcus piscis]GHG04920.1 lactoylglutathione lyase [Deinococcus piscis]
MAFKHVSFLTRDLDRTLAFYALLGAGLLKRLRTPEGYDRAVLDLGGARVQFFQIAGEQPAPHPHWAEHLALEVPDLGLTVEQLRGAGYRLSREVQPSPGGRPMAFVLDPDGRSVELLQQD